jgi:4-hydroxy-tetrahydrodipicolinate synthase
MFKGSIVAAITPFAHNHVDEGAFRRFIDWQIIQGTDGIVVCGSTGEGALLTREERKQLITTAVACARGRVPIIVGCGGPATADVLTMVQEAGSLGADAALVVAPYYSKPSQAGLMAHFQTIHEGANLPIILYNNPGRSVVDIHVDTVIELAALERVVGIKDSTADLSRVTTLRRNITKPFALLSGDDPFGAAYLAGGGDGIISVTANVAPALCKALYTAWTNKNIEAYQALNQQLMPLHLAMVMETNPCPVKYGVHKLGLCAHEMRLPLLPVKPETANHIAKIMAELGLSSHGRHPTT